MQCIEAAVALLRWQGIRLATYLDDWLLLAQSKQEARAHTRVLIRHLFNLGFNLGKDRAVSSTGHNLYGIILGLGNFHSAPLGRTSENFQGMSRALSSRQICSIQIVSSITQADGICHPRRPSRPPPHKEFQLWVASCGLDPLRCTESAGHNGCVQ